MNKPCQLAYLEIRLIGSIPQCLSVEATRTLVSSLVLSRLDYSNFLLAGSPQVLLDKIQKVINCSARLICRASKSAHITSLLFDLHWLPISSRIQYKIALACFHIISGTAPPYLSELLHLFSFSFSLFSLRYSDFPCPQGVQEDFCGEILSVYRTCHLELSSFLCQTCVTLLFQVKTENPPLLFCLLIYRFLSSVSIKPMTTMLVFL